jgi:hypothetical protein
MADEPTQKEQVKAANLSRAQLAKIAHEKANERRAQHENELRVSYAKIKDEPAFLDIIKKLKGFSSYHEKMAKDGVGFQETGERDASGNISQRTVFYDKDKRLSELDKSSGLDEGIAYIEGRVTKERLEQVRTTKVIDPSVGSQSTDSPAVI